MTIYNLVCQAAVIFLLIEGSKWLYEKWQEHKIMKELKDAPIDPLIEEMYATLEECGITQEYTKLIHNGQWNPHLTVEQRRIITDIMIHICKKEQEVCK